MKKEINRKRLSTCENESENYGIHYFVFVNLLRAVFYTILKEQLLFQKKKNGIHQSPPFPDATQPCSIF